MDKLHYRILNFLNTGECFSRLRSIPLSNIEKGLESRASTVNKKMGELIEAGYIKKGIKDGRAFTYFISEDGIEKLKEEIS